MCRKSNNLYRVITLTQGYVAIIDSKDYRRVNKHSWRVHFSKGKNKQKGEPYARATIKGKDIYLHRFITQAPPELHVDHKNHQTLDCRGDNLECVTPMVNHKRRRNSKQSVSKKSNIPLHSEMVSSHDKSLIIH